MALPRDPAADPATPDPARVPASLRRRGRVLERAIFAAALDQLTSVGWTRLTMEGVAAGAQTGKAALYRRWSCKEDLVVDALNDALPSFADPPDRGDVREDLIEVLQRMSGLLNSPLGAAIRAVMCQVDRDPAFHRLVHERVLLPRKRLFHQVMRRAAERGEVRADAADGLVPQVGPAMMLQRLLTDEGEISDEFIVQLVDDVLMPLLRPRP